MTGILVTISLFYGCALNTNTAHPEYPEIQQLRLVVESVVTALCEAGRQKGDTTVRFSRGLYALIVAGDENAEADHIRSSFETESKSIVLHFFLLPPVRAPSLS